MFSAWSNERGSCSHQRAPSVVKFAPMVLTFLVGLGLALSIVSESARADELSANAAQMSDRAFALLNTLNAQSGGGSANPLLAPVASFASDAQTLANALAKGDAADVAADKSAVEADKEAVDVALAAHPGAIKGDAWNEVKSLLDRVDRQFAAAKSVGAGESAPAVPASAPPPPAAPSKSTVSGSADASSTSAPDALSASDRSAPPKVEIDSREVSNGVLHVKGYIDGTDLKSAGIYESGRLLQNFKVSGVVGEQKVDLDLGIAHPSPQTIISVTDAQGRSAQAPVMDTTASAGETASAMPSETSPAPGVLGRSPEEGVDVMRGAGAAGGSHANTEEIPSHGAVTPSPSKRHTIGGKLGNVQINVLAVTQTRSVPPTYHVIGQISGQGVTRAGIYVDGRLAARIPVEDANYTSFDQTFEMNGGAATIRAFGVGDQFVESNIDLSDNDMASLSTMPSAPMAPAATGLAVQITSVRQVGANLYVVSGVISGSGLSSAGLYQNGVLAQNVNLGIGGLIGSLIPGTNRSATFNVRFNPAMGPATIRAFDTNGNYTEQPVMIAGVNPYPYGYGASPYAGVNPYATSPYGGAVSPYYGAPPLSRYYTYPPRPAPAPAPRPLW